MLRTISLSSIAARGNTYASRRFGKYAPPNNAMAAMGVMLAGCGISRAKAAATTMPVNTIKRLFMAIPCNDPNCYMGEKMDDLTACALWDPEGVFPGLECPIDTLPLRRWAAISLRRRLASGSCAQGRDGPGPRGGGRE